VVPAATDLNALLGKIASGDQAAFRAFYEATVDRCTGVATSVLRSTVWADDCVADTYVQVWRTAGQFDSSRGHALAWLTMLCRTRAIDRLRKEQAQLITAAELIAEHRDDDMQDRFGDMQATGALKSALAQLSGEQRRALELTYFQGLSNSEIAKITGWPLGTTKSHVRRALAVLRKELLDDVEH
jgi:RNA polymerase sigma-70 factor (ECF subfamily)